MVFRLKKWHSVCYFQASFKCCIEMKTSHSKCDLHHFTQNCIMGLNQTVCHLSTYHCPLHQRTTQCVHPAPQQWCGSCHRPPARHHWCPSLAWARSDSDCHCDLLRGETQDNRGCCWHTKRRGINEIVETKRAQSNWEISFVPSLPKSPSPQV